MLRVEHISKSWCGKPLLNNISFEVNSGECIVIFGKSGGGKSSLLKIIAGIELPDEGSILVDGEVQVKSNEQLIPGNPIIKLVNQDFSLDLYHRVEENIRLKILHLTHAEQDELCEELLDLMELTELRHEKALTLSGGEQQRLALARALALRPRYLLLDEPFAHLDFALKTRVEQYILTKKSVIHVTSLIPMFSCATSVMISISLSCPTISPKLIKARYSKGTKAKMV